MGYSKSSFKREVCSNKYLSQGTEKLSNKQSNFTTEGTGRRRISPKLVEGRKY